MEPKIFHGDISPSDIVRALVAQFNRGNWRVNTLGSGDHMATQIVTNERSASGGNTALTVQIRKVPDGVAVQIGKQDIFGVAASLGMTALTTLRNPWTIINRIDDLAQDIENLKLSEMVWETVESVARGAGASFDLSDRLKRTICAYCDTANPVGEASCIACGAPLGKVQPRTCPKCGYIIQTEEHICPNCGNKLK